jgi:hypothetical protein
MLINKPDWKQWRGNTLSENEESDDDLFGDNNLVSTLADKFEFPEEGALGYTMAGGGVGYGDGHQTEGLVVVDRETNQIAFIPDFTYFDDEPTQEDLEVLFYDDDSEYGTQRLPLTVQNIQKFLSLDEDTSDYCTEGAEAELEELPERPRKTTTKPDIRFDIPHQQAQDQPLAHIDPLDDLLKKAGLGSDTPSDDIRKARQADTLNKTAGLSTPDMSNMLSRMKDIELDNDLEPYQDAAPEMLPSVDVTTKNLPAVAGQALQASGVQTPEFHQVSNLPGNMADQIRQLGKSVFGSLTMTPTKRIHVIANLGGQGPNTTPEVQAVAGFLKKYGDDRGPGDVDFEQVMPGYRAQTHMYTAAGIRWMLVKDFAGQYIYCWPEEDSHDASPVLGHDKPEQGRLR